MTNSEEKVIKSLDVFKTLSEELDTEDYKMLLTLYGLRSYSGFEQPVRNYIEKLLMEWNIPYINLNGNIVGMNHANAPILSAHMDMVNTDNYHLKPQEDSILNAVFTLDDEKNIRLYKLNSTTKEPVQTSLGADDKNGIWITLLLLKRGFKINFIFSHGEECGCVGIKQVVADAKIAQFIEQCTYALVIDRRNKNDIIGYGNDYCLALDDRLQAFSTENGFNYTCANGLCSDANHISSLIETVNLSCGYYNAHTAREHTNMEELIYCFNFVSKILKEFTFKSVSGERIRKFKKVSKPYKTEKEIQAEIQKEKEKEENRNKDMAKKTETSAYQPSLYSRTNYTSWLKKDSGTNEATRKKEIDTKIDTFYDSYDMYEDYNEDEEIAIEVLNENAALSRGEVISAFDKMVCPYCGEMVYTSKDDIELFKDDLNLYDELRQKNKITYYCECGEIFSPLDVVTFRDELNGV